MLSHTCEQNWSDEAHDGLHLATKSEWTVGAREAVVVSAQAHAGVPATYRSFLGPALPLQDHCLE